MADNKARSITHALEDLLERERHLVLAGEIEQLTRLAPEKERLLQSLAACDSSPTDLEHLRLSTERNQQLLTAAARGIRSVKQRLDALMNGQSELRTYTRDGFARDLSRRESRFERKA
ncbi:flagellar protein FlgN [Aliiroseovarius sp. S2029]|uniref:flagellar protein FlgN n=1 Tax=Aliiroseovarius sp. S2029 TaxID=2936988 RepID=UPI0020BFEF04|nr:flagellar protein FlgN [Aliiroseovarius sp. S2029]MCK8484491.1 flagellar protein FlgN [Aliiroseovarius sp. S2029]